MVFENTALPNKKTFLFVDDTCTAHIKWAHFVRLRAQRPGMRLMTVGASPLGEPELCTAQVLVGLPGPRITAESLSSFFPRASVPRFAKAPGCAFVSDVLRAIQWEDFLARFEPSSLPALDIRWWGDVRVSHHFGARPVTLGSEFLNIARDSDEPRTPEDRAKAVAIARALFRLSEGQGQGWNGGGEEGDGSLSASEALDLLCDEFGLTVAGALACERCSSEEDDVLALWDALHECFVRKFPCDP